MVSINDAEYGILQFNLLKPRIFAAGALFVLLVAIPTVAVRRVIRRSPIPADSGQSWLKWSFDTNRYFNMCLILAFASYGVMWEGTFDDISKQFSHFQTLALALIMFLSILITRTFRHNYKTNPKKCALLPMADFILVNLLVLYVLRIWTGYATFVYWFFVVGLYAAWLDDRFKNAKKRQRLSLIIH